MGIGSIFFPRPVPPLLTLIYPRRPSLPRALVGRYGIDVSPRPGPLYFFEDQFFGLGS